MRLVCLHGSGKRQTPPGSAGADIFLLQPVPVMPWGMLSPQTSPDPLPKKSWQQLVDIYPASWTLSKIGLLGVSLQRGM